MTLSTEQPRSTYLTIERADEVRKLCMERLDVMEDLSWADSLYCHCAVRMIRGGGGYVCPNICDKLRDR